MDFEHLVGQRFGNREIISVNCTDSDWTDLGLKVPNRKDKYVMTLCLNCGTKLPADRKNLRVQPPKRCVFCSNIGNHSNVDTLTNNWVVYDDCAVCNVTYNNHVISFYVDVCDYDLLSKYTWRISKKRQKYYVITGSAKKNTMQYLHAIVYGAVNDGMEIDHIDGNSLNNRRANLRAVSRQENIDNQRATRIDNQIGIRGIAYDKHRKTYSVDFYFHHSRYYTRPWKSIEEAVWCRKCFEDFFGLEVINNNPLAQQYLTLSNEEMESIRTYVLEIIGNDR